MSGAPYEAFGLSEVAWTALARAELLALDVDGTLTDGRVIYVGDAESQQFCVRDGQGLAWLRQAGIQLAWITGRGSKPTEQRAAELGVAAFRPRSGPKDEVLAAVQAELGVAPECTIAMGDDLPDLLMAKRAAFFAAPADAREEVCESADWVAPACAGGGAVRALCELILRARGEWDALLARYGG